MICASRLALACVAGLFFGGSNAAAAPIPARPGYGILLLAHGGSPGWNAQVSEVLRAVNKEVPSEAAFGMADADSIDAAAALLKRRGVARIVAVPLFVSSRSSLMDQTRYVLGLRRRPSSVFVSAMRRVMRSEPAVMARYASRYRVDLRKRAAVKIPLVLTRAMDDDPLIADILVDRAKILSRHPARETVILVAHGPITDAANDSWLRMMRQVARRIKKAGGYRAVEAVTLRDDCAPPIKARAAAMLRRMVERADNRGGRTIVLPYLVSSGGIEKYIAGILKGLPYAWNGKPLCPHPNIARWVLKRGREGAGHFLRRGNR